MGNTTSQDTIYALRTAGQDSQCGLPFCCPGESMKCATSESAFLPNELEGFLTVEELKAMTKEIDELFARTVMPMFPCLLGHFCLPFSPVCAMMYFANQRDKGLREIFEKHNSMLVERGLYWERTSHGNNARIFIMLPFAVLKYNRAARERYLQSAPPHLNAPCPGTASGPPSSSTYPSVPVAAASVVPMAMEGPPSYAATAPSLEKLQEQNKSY